jgi:hypothetical protein
MWIERRGHMGLWSRWSRWLNGVGRRSHVLPDEGIHTVVTVYPPNLR